MAESSTAATAKTVWRVALRKYQRYAFSGTGPKEFGARWNPAGFPVVYTSESLALASVEFFVHLEEEGMHAELIAIPAELPPAIKTVQVDVADLPPRWREELASKALRDFGVRWVEEGASAVLVVPSAVIPSERNYLLNPAHPDFKKIKIHAPLPFGFDSRMWKGHPRSRA